MQTQIIPTTLSSVNQTAVPSKVRKLLNLESGDKLLWEVTDTHHTVTIKPAPKKWGDYMRGLGKHLWKGEKTDTYIDKLREDRDI